MYPMLNIAVRAARKAGNLIAKYYEIPDNIEASYKDNNNFVIRVSKAAELIIIDSIHKSYPQHSILAKNSDLYRSNNQNIQWVIYPLDSKINFTKRLPHFAVSIAVRVEGRTEIAVVYDPIRNELFTAVRGGGAQLNGYRLRGSKARDLSSAILATGFPLKTREDTTLYMKVISNLFTECADFRCTGSAALDLAYVAAGRVDGYFEINLKPYNFTAGELIAREAAALVCDFTGGCNYLQTGNIVAGNSRIVKAMLINIRKKMNEIQEH